MRESERSLQTMRVATHRFKRGERKVVSQFDLPSVARRTLEGGGTPSLQSGARCPFEHDRRFLAPIRYSRKGQSETPPTATKAKSSRKRTVNEPLRAR